MTLQDLIDELASDNVDLKTFSNDELGRISNPEARPLNPILKFLDNAAPLHGLFGVDSEKEGAALRKALTMSSIESALETSRAEKKKQKDMLGLLDADLSGNISGGELPLSQQDMLRSQGLFPQREVPVDALGPTRPLFKPRSLGDDAQGIVPDQLGTGSTMASEMGLNPDVEAMIASGKPGSDRLADLLTSNTVSDVQGIADPLLRKLDPGLQATGTEEDPDAALPNAIARQAFEATSTDLRTPRSRSEPDFISKKDMGTALTAIMMQTGASEDEISATVSAFNDLPGNVPAGFAKTIIDQVSKARGETAKIAAKQQLTEEVQDRLDTRQEERYKLISGLNERGAVLDFTKQAALKVLANKFAVEMQAGAYGNQKKLAFEKDKRRFAHDFAMFAKKEALTKEETQFKFGAQAVLQTMNGQAALNMETVRQGHRIALKNAGPGANSKDVLKEFITGFMKSSPVVAEQFVDLIANTPPGEDPFMIQTTREAMADLYREIVDSDTAFEVVRIAQGTNVIADTLGEKTAWLASEKARLGAGQPSKGIPPMRPGQLKVIQDQIDYNESLMEKGGQRITIMGDEKPLSAMEAGKIADVYLNTFEIDNVYSKLFKEDGSVDRATLQTMQDVTVLPGFFGDTFGWRGVPFTEGREVAQKLKRIIDTIIRAKSGAEVPEADKKDLMDMFWPNSFDSAEGVRAKADRLRDYHDLFLSLADPRGSQRTKMSAGKPQQTLQNPSKLKPRKQVIRELLDAGTDPDDINEALQGMGY